MNQRWLRLLGYGLVGLIVVGAFGVALIGALGGEPWVWRNYWHASLTTWGVLTTFGAVILWAVVWVGIRALRWAREKSLPPG